jgi:hypothetical protein
MSWMAKRRMMVQIIPRVIFRLPSTISEREGEGEGEREGERGVNVYISNTFGLRTTKLSINT